MPQIHGVIILTSSRTRAKLSSSQKKTLTYSCRTNYNKMATKDRRAIYTNPSAQYWVSKEEAPVDIVGKFHQSLPGFTPTRLVSLDAMAKEIGVAGVYVKYEGNRWELPSFKILGASWATNRAIAKACGLPDNVGLDDLGAAARDHAIRLFAATDGNHGRAVAKMARTLGIAASIYVPKDMDQPTWDFITGEGAQMFVLDGDYDKAVITAAHESRITGGILIQDTGFEGYGEIPKVSCVFPKARDKCNKLGS
jgi:diaminopropionate ammonia-lyase family